MAICPDHGGYTGDACRKCQDKKPECPQCFEEERSYSCVRPAHGKLGPIPSVSAELKAALKEANVLPKLEEADKLTLVKLENASLKSFHAMQNAQAQFQNFAKMMFEKYKVKGGECTLDMERLEFVTRSL